MKSELPQEINLNGRVLLLKSGKLREAFTSLTSLESDIESLKKSGADKARLVTLLLRLYHTLDEVQHLIQKEKREEFMFSDAAGSRMTAPVSNSQANSGAEVSSKRLYKNEGGSSQYNVMLAHVQMRKLTSCKERNLLQAQLYAQ